MCGSLASAAVSPISSTPMKEKITIWKPCKKPPAPLLKKPSAYRLLKLAWPYLVEPELSSMKAAKITKPTIIKILMIAKANSRFPKKRAEIKLIKSRTATESTPGSQVGRLGSQDLK